MALDERAAPTNGLVIALIGTREPLGIAMDHGMEAISEPLRVTKAAGNVVLEVEGRPASDIWKEITAPHASEQGLDLEALNTNADVQTYLSHFQLGLSTGKAGERLKIRWPAGLTPKAGIAFSGIPEGCVIRITKGSVKSHIASATRAAVQARALAGTKLAGALVFDCGIRKVTLGDRFFDAVKAISSALHGVPLAGFETFGEVALEPGNFRASTTRAPSFWRSPNSGPPQRRSWPGLLAVVKDPPGQGNTGRHSPLAQPSRPHRVSDRDSEVVRSSGAFRRHDSLHRTNRSPSPASGPILRCSPRECAALGLSRYVAVARGVPSLHRVKPVRIPDVGLSFAAVPTWLE